MSSTRASDGGAPPAVVVLAGSEAMLRDAALAELRERALGAADRSFNEDRFDLGAGADPRRILTAAWLVPFMAPRRLVIVRGLGDRRAARFTEGPLLEYLDSPSPTTCLVLEAEALDRRLRWVKKAGSVGEVRDCSAPRRAADVRRWIEARLRGLDKKAGRGAAAALYELIGSDLDRLSHEIDKVALYVGDRGEVRADDVAEVTGALRPLALYELTDAIGGRRLPDALRVLARLLDQGEAPLAILGALGNHVRRLLRAHDCDRLEAREVQRRLAIHPYAAEKLAEQARGFEPARLRRCLREVARTDAAIKGALPLPPAAALEHLLTAVCA